MKTLIALALLAVLGFAAAGCGATKKIVVNMDTNSLATKVATEYTGTITVVGSTTTTIANVKTGTRVTCKGWKGLGVKVPRRGEAEAVGHSESTIGVKPSGTEQMSLTHRQSGWLTVTCTPSN